MEGSTTCCVIVFALLFSIGKGDLSKHLRHYEFVQHFEVHHVQKRSAEENAGIEKVVKVNAVGRNMTLRLSLDNRIFAKDFRVTVVDKDDNVKTDNDIDVRKFYRGHVSGEDKSEVTAYFEDTDTMMATIVLPDEEITIEPSGRHFGRTHKLKSMIAYRTHDLIWPSAHNLAAQQANNTNSPSFCGAVHIDGGEGQGQEQAEESSQGHRSKRATSNRCMLMAVADKRFFDNVGEGDKYKTAMQIVNVISLTNTIFTRTNFGSTGYGFELQELRIHDSYSNVDVYPYNVNPPTWQDAKGLLTAFSKDYVTFREFCLAHLFTYQDLNNVFGMAYIASSSTSNLGGICSPSSGGYIYNTGFTTYADDSGNLAPARMLQLVTAHEFGHNWGSEHDSGSDCTPSSLFGDGKYLMYQYSVTGEDPNNEYFSSCSKAYISRVLSAKASSCFSAASAVSLCGNGKLDAGEACDGGILGALNSDSCCDSNCRLKNGAVCSPMNYACCSSSCQIAPTTTVCGGGECLNETKCNGIDLTCPTPIPMADGTGCRDGGSCRSGVCTAYCEYRGLISCVCDTVANSCKKCCRASSSSACSVHNSSAIHANKRPCLQGYCESGICVKADVSLAERLFDIIQSISIDYLIEAFKTNMVAFTQVFTLLVYIPLCLIFWCKDRKSRKKREKLEKLGVRENRNLMYDLDGNRIPYKNVPQLRKHRNITTAAPVPPIYSRSQPPPSANVPRVITSASSRRNRIAPLTPKA